MIQARPFREFFGVASGAVVCPITAQYPLSSSEDRWKYVFYCKGGCIVSTVQDYALVTGLCFGSSSFDPNEHLNAKKSRLHRRVCGRGTKRARELLTMITTNPDRFEGDEDILLSLANVLIANTFILGHDIKSAPFAWLWHLADDLEEFNRFPWGAYNYITLRYYVENAQDSSTYHVYGPAWALLIWGYEVIGGMENVVGSLEDEDVYPRYLRWKFGRNPSDISDEQFFMIIDDPRLSLRNIEPTPFEYDFEYFRSPLLPNPLDIAFYVPLPVTGDPTQFPHEARPRRPMHDPEDIHDDASGSRLRRSTQSRTYMGEDLNEQTSARRS